MRNGKKVTTPRSCTPPLPPGSCPVGPYWSTWPGPRGEGGQGTEEKKNDEAPFRTKIPNSRQRSPPPLLSQLWVARGRGVARPIVRQGHGVFLSVMVVASRQWGGGGPLAPRRRLNPGGWGP